MTPRYLLDSNALSEPLRPAPNATFLRRLQEAGDQIATASVVWHELHFGLERLPASARKRQVAAWLAALAQSDLVILPYDQRAAEWQAAERARLERAGRPLPFRDAQIGAIARVHGLVLVTANVADFAPMSGLVVESWVE